MKKTFISLRQEIRILCSTFPTEMSCTIRC